MIDISNMDRAEVLAKLYNAAKPQGLGFLHYTPEHMTVEQAQALLDSGQEYFDYVKGRVMKISLSTRDGNNLNERLYDRDNGDGAAARALGLLT